MSYRWPVPLTPRQNQTIDWIHDYWASTGGPPTIRQICDAMGWRSTNSAACILDRLERVGLIERRGLRKYRAVFMVRPVGHCPACGQALPGVAR